MRTLLLLGTLTLLASCGATGEGPSCAAWRPLLTHVPPEGMRPAEAAEAGYDVLTDPTVRDILAHNLTGRRLCGW